MMVYVVWYFGCGEKEIYGIYSKRENAEKAAVEVFDDLCLDKSDFESRIEERYIEDLEDDV